LNLSFLKIYRYLQEAQVNGQSYKMNYRESFDTLFSQNIHSHDYNVLYNKIDRINKKGNCSLFLTSRYARTWYMYPAAGKYIKRLATHRWDPQIAFLDRRTLELRKTRFKQLETTHQRWPWISSKLSEHPNGSSDQPFLHKH
jgi:hypothetical protein